MTVKKEHFDRITAQQAARRRGPPEEAELAGFIAQVPSPPGPPRTARESPAVPAGPRSAAAVGDQGLCVVRRHAL